jgi:hypothetical protein
MSGTCWETPDDQRFDLSSSCPRDAGGFPTWFYFRHSTNNCIFPAAVNGPPPEGANAILVPCLLNPEGLWQETSFGSVRSRNYSACLSTKTSGNSTLVSLSYNCSDPANRFEVTANGSLRHVASGLCVAPAVEPPTPGATLVLRESCGVNATTFTRTDLSYCDSLDNGSLNPCHGNATCTQLAGDGVLTATRANCTCNAGKDFWSKGISICVWTEPSTCP